MSQNTLASTGSTQSGAPSRKSKKGDERCMVCGKRYRRLRADHLAQHGLTRERYQRIYGARIVGATDDGISGSADQSAADPHLALIAKLGQRVVDSSGFLDALAGEVSEHILSSAPLRTQVAFAAAQVIQARVRIHADAVGRLARVSDQLDEPWRIEAGGTNGKPTPTKDLLGIAMQAHAEIVKAEEMVVKAARLALDERKASDAAATAPGFVYSGAAEAITIPRDLGAADREALRALMGNLTRHVEVQRKARQAITMDVEQADGTPMPSADPVSHHDDAQDAPAAPGEPAADPLGMTKTARPARRRRRTA